MWAKKKPFFFYRLLLLLVWTPIFMCYPGFYICLLFLPVIIRWELCWWIGEWTGCNDRTQDLRCQICLNVKFWCAIKITKGHVKRNYFISNKVGIKMALKQFNWMFLLFKRYKNSCRLQSMTFVWQSIISVTSILSFLVSFYFFLCAI